MQTKNSSPLEDCENRWCTGGNCTPLTRRFPGAARDTTLPAHSCWSLRFASLLCQNTTSSSPAIPLQAAFLDMRVGLKPVIQLFTTSAHKVIMCLCSCLSMFFCSLHFCNKAIRKKQLNAFPDLKSSFACDRWPQPWLYGVVPLRFPPAVSVPGAVPRGNGCTQQWTDTLPARCRQRSAGTAAATGSWICPKFVQVTTCHWILKGWLHTPQAELSELSFLFLFNSVSVASVIKVLPTLHL